MNSLSFALRTAAAAALIAITIQAASAQETIAVTVDQSLLVKLPERVSTLIIGNPLIVDAVVQPSGLMVLTGKGYGATNLIALDAQGAVLMERSISVNTATGLVTVYRGVRRESYACDPTCQPRIALGDDAQFFSVTLGQATTRARQAESASATSNR
jgi:Flp pilus assembly secretin CpaC